jgi:hypothetical protein
MSDITMCSGESVALVLDNDGMRLEAGFECPLRDTCCRYKANPSKENQGWFAELPYDKLNEECEYYWTNVH